MRRQWFKIWIMLTLLGYVLLLAAVPASASVGQQPPPPTATPPAPTPAQPALGTGTLVFDHLFTSNTFDSYLTYVHDVDPGALYRIDVSNNSGAVVFDWNIVPKDSGVPSCRFASFGGNELVFNNPSRPSAYLASPSNKTNLSFCVVWGTANASPTNQTSARVKLYKVADAPDLDFSDNLMRMYIGGSYIDYVRPGDSTTSTYYNISEYTLTAAPGYTLYLKPLYFIRQLVGGANGNDIKPADTPLSKIIADIYNGSSLITSLTADSIGYTFDVGGTYVVKLRQERSFSYELGVRGGAALIELGGYYPGGAPSPTVEPTGTVPALPDNCTRETGTVNDGFIQLPRVGPFGQKDARLWWQFPRSLVTGTDGYLLTARIQDEDGLVTSRAYAQMTNTPSSMVFPVQIGRDVRVYVDSTHSELDGQTVNFDLCPAGALSDGTPVPTPLGNDCQSFQVQISTSASNSTGPYIYMAPGHWSISMSWSAGGNNTTNNPYITVNVKDFLVSTTASPSKRSYSWEYDTSVERSGKLSIVSAYATGAASINICPSNLSGTPTATVTPLPTNSGCVSYIKSINSELATNILLGPGRYDIRLSWQFAPFSTQEAAIFRLKFIPAPGSNSEDYVNPIPPGAMPNYQYPTFATFTRQFVGYLVLDDNKYPGYHLPPYNEKVKVDICPPGVGTVTPTLTPTSTFPAVFSPTPTLLPGTPTSTPTATATGTLEPTNTPLPTEGPGTPTRTPSPVPPTAITPQIVPPAGACQICLSTPVANLSPVPELGIVLPTLQSSGGYVVATISISVTSIVGAVQTIEIGISTPIAGIRTSTAQFSFEAGQQRASGWATQMQPALNWLSIVNPNHPAYQSSGGPLWALAPVLLPVLPIIGASLFVAFIRFFIWIVGWFLKLLDVIFKLLELIPGE